MSEAARGDKDDPFTCSKCGGPTKENGRWHPDLGTIYGYELGLGDATCGKRNGEFRRSVCWSARDLVKLRGDPACVDCGSTGMWDADHHVPLWEGGEHAASNIVRRCEPCHKRKTAEEAGRRAGKVSGEVHDEQLALATSGEES